MIEHDACTKLKGIRDRSLMDSRANNTGLSIGRI